MSNPKWSRGWFFVLASAALWLLIFCLWAAAQ